MGFIATYVPIIMIISQDETVYAGFNDQDAETIGMIIVIGQPLLDIFTNPRPHLLPGSSQAFSHAIL